MRHTPPETLNKAYRDLKKCSPAAKSMSAWFAGRERSARFTKVRVAVDRLEVSREEVIGLFRTLDAMGAGRFITGRRGKESRFAWSYDPKSLGQTNGSMS